MKKLPTILVACIICLFGCTNEQLESDQLKKAKPKSNPIVIANDAPDTDNGEHCVYTQLIAGQHYSAGSVTIDVVGDNLVVTYTTNGDWTIGTTHLSIGVCEDGWVPTTGSAPFSDTKNEFSPNAMYNLAPDSTSMA